MQIASSHVGLDSRLQCSGAAKRSQLQHATLRAAHRYRATLRCCKSNNKQRTWTTMSAHAGRALDITGLAVAVLAFTAASFSLDGSWADAAQQHTQTLPHMPILDLAEGEEEFWGNLARYGRYFITVLLGTAYITVKPIIALLKRPKTAVLVVGGAALLYIFVSSTVSAMLGVTDPTSIQPSQFLPENY